MNVHRSRSDYLTTKNLAAKTRTWLSAVRPFLREHRIENFPFRSDEAALFVIDAQRYFFDRESPAFLPASAIILPHLETLCSAFRRWKRPVYFSRQAPSPNDDPGLMGRWWKHAVYDGEPLAEIIPSLLPEDSNNVFAKTKYSAFTGTDLENRLRSSGIEQVVIAGVLTHLCCETTAREAFMRDFEVFFVLDATASRSEDLHVAGLKTLADGFARIVTTKEILSCFG